MTATLECAVSLGITLRQLASGSVSPPGPLLGLMMIVNFTLVLLVTL